MFLYGVKHAVSSPQREEDNPRFKPVINYNEYPFRQSSIDQVN